LLTFGGSIPISSLWECRYQRKSTSFHVYNRQECWLNSRVGTTGMLELGALIFLDIRSGWIVRIVGSDEEWFVQ
jgi:hypothetical protein